MKKFLYVLAGLVVSLAVSVQAQTPVSDAQLRSAQQSGATAGAVPYSVPAPPSIAARAYILIDAHSGKVLVEHNADERLAPASLTKMMTGYVLSEQVKQGMVSWNDTTHVSSNAWAQNPVFEGSSLMWIQVDTDVSLIDLYRGLVISSGNDASVAIAEHLAGSEDSFAGLMNQQAQRLGMTNSHFVNAHGLPHPEHYTTARDLATLSRAMIFDHPEDYKIYSETSYTYNNIRQGNRNELLGQGGVDGIKTGHTDEAGYCLVSSAEQDGMRLISVVLGTDSKRARKEETRKLLSWGNRFFETRQLFGDRPVMAQAKVWAGAAKNVELGIDEGFYITLPRGQFDAIEAVPTVEPVVVAPVALGAELGRVSVTAGGQEIANLPLTARAEIAEAGFFAALWDKLVLFFMQLFGQV